MSRARTLADFISTGVGTGILADGAIDTTEITGVTATSAELNIMDGVTATSTEINRLAGVTSDVQTQLDSKASTSNPTFTGTVTADKFTVGDNDKITLGNSDDFEIYHNSTSGFIEVGPYSVSDLLITATDDVIIGHGTASSYENMAFFGNDGSVFLYYNGTEKLKTVSNGIDVSGYVYTDSGLVHNGDTDTYIAFGTNTQTYYTGGSERLKLDSSGVEINNEYHLPTSDGTSGQIMQTNGSGTLTFVDQSSGANIATTMAFA